jgi:hypothetical protein
MTVNFNFVTHVIPLWFLVLSLFFPRLCLLVAWIQHTPPSGVFAGGLLPVVTAVLIPRVLILVLIYRDQGIALWFIIHLIALLMAWGGGASRFGRRRGD